MNEVMAALIAAAATLATPWVTVRAKFWLEERREALRGRGGDVR